MVDLQLGMVITAEGAEGDKRCNNCCFQNVKVSCGNFISCSGDNRKDGRRVYFKMVNMESVARKINAELDAGRISNVKSILKSLTGE